MPKMKTNKSAAKRFRSNKKGRIKRAKAFRSHICTKKSSKRKRSLRRRAFVGSANERNIRKQLPYG